MPGRRGDHPAPPAFRPDTGVLRTHARPSYTVRPAELRPELKGLWDGPAWKCAETLKVSCFRPEGSRHRPRTSARLLYDGEGLWGIFRVEDRFVRSVHTQNGDPVYRDSCVEAFLQPKPGQGYVNLEFNAGGAVLSSHVLDPTRTPDGLRDSTVFTPSQYEQLRVHHSLPAVVEPEVPDPVVWVLEFFVPFSILTKSAPGGVPAAGAEWAGNFFKCGDDTSHPHWASWSPLSERNFHLPGCFGSLRFAGARSRPGRRR